MILKLFLHLISSWRGRKSERDQKDALDHVWNLSKVWVEMLICWRLHTLTILCRSWWSFGIYCIPLIVTAWYPSSSSSSISFSYFSAFSCKFPLYQNWSDGLKSILFYSFFREFSLQPEIMRSNVFPFFRLNRSEILKNGWKNRKEWKEERIEANNDPRKKETEGKRKTETRFLLE